MCVNRKLLFVAIAMAAAGRAQSFEVASVKAADPNQHQMDFRTYPGGRLKVLNQRLGNLIQWAFAIKAYQISGGPPWLKTDLFDIDAKAQGDPSREQMMAMLQTLLADRFQLKVHRKTEEGNVYTLVVAKGGAKLKPSTADQTYVRLYRNTPLDQVGVSYTIGGQKASLALIAERLGDMELGRPVLDRTGIKGEFDFKLDYGIGDNLDAGPSIFSAIQEQLGLKLEATKGPIEMLVIDKAEKPSGN